MSDDILLAPQSVPAGGAVLNPFVIVEAVRPPYEPRETVRQLYELGCRSLPLIAASGFAVGIVLIVGARMVCRRKDDRGPR